MKIRKPDYSLLRTPELNLFKYSKHGLLLIIRGFKTRYINLSINVLIDKDSVLNYLEEIYDNVEHNQQRRDIKEAIAYLSETF